MSQFLFCFLLDPGTPFTNFISKTLTVLGDVFQHHLVEQDRNRVEVAGEGVRSNTQGFQRDRSATGEGVEYQRACAGCAAEGFVCGLCQCATGGEISLVGRIVPVGKIGNEVQQGTAQFLKVIEQRRILARAVEPAPTFRRQQHLSLVRCPFLHGLPRRIEKLKRAVRIGRIGPERGEDDCAAGCQRPACPPDMQRRDVPVTDAFLAPRMGRNPLDG